jgi:phosphoglycolate phosphatase
VGVVTSNSQKAVLDTFARQGLSNHAATNHTSSNHTSSDSQLAAPKFVKGGIGMSGKRTALQKIIEKYQIEKTELLYLGDEIRDVTSCIEVGVDIAAVSWGFNTRSALASANPTYILEKPEELRQLVGI